MGRKFTIFALFYFVFKGKFQVQAPWGTYIWRGDVTEGFLRYDLGGPIFGGAYFQNFTVANLVYSYFEKGCQIECTRQPRKVLWVVHCFSEKFDRMAGEAMDMSVSANGKQQKQVRQLQCQEQCIEHIPYYLSGLSHIFPTTFLEIAVG